MPQGRTLPGAQDTLPRSFTFALLAAVALAGCGSPAAVTTVRHVPAGRNAASVPVSRAYAEQLARLVAQPIPYRSLYTLADEMRLHPPRPIAHVIRRSSPNYRVGHTDTFRVLSEDQNRYFSLTATIRAETPHLYLYVQNGVKVNQAAVEKAAQTFEQKIYPADHTFFGSEWDPGVDGDPHITCLVGNLRSSGAAGFFSAEDEYPHLVNPDSNQREMIYLNSVATLPGDADFDQFMAHEFQHMIHWHMHPHDNAWLNEGMSMLAEDVNHYPPTDEPGAFTEVPTTQLNSWTLDGLSSFAHYGAAYLFLAYLYDRFGRGFIHDVVADSRYTDFQVIDDVLRRHHIGETADQLFAQWVIANTLDDRSVSPLYAYRQLPTTVQIPQQESSVPFTSRGTIPPYAAQYTSLAIPQNQKPFHLHFAAPDTVPVVSFRQPVTTPFWWGNRGDMSDTRLERTVDLRRVKSATLHFRVWYDIETDYDYAYVEASTDGGKTWQTLPGRHTTTANPYGASYGNGYTGNSKGWQNESIDLSHFAGRSIKLRFEYVTDDEYTGQGFAIQGISIPEIGFHDSYSGWQEQGFVPVLRNAMPSSWTVQIIAYTRSGIRVSRMPISANGQGDLSETGALLIDPAAEGMTKLTAVVFTTAPKTTARTTYTLSAGE